GEADHIPAGAPEEERIVLQGRLRTGDVNDRRVVDRGDGEVDLVRGRVGVDPRIGGAAVVLDHEAEPEVALGPVLVLVPAEDEVAGGDVGGAAEAAAADRNAVQQQTAVRNRGADHAGKGIAVGIGEAEVGGGQRVGLVLVDGDGLVRARRRVV